MQLDIAFGDAGTPPALETAFPTILDGPATRIVHLSQGDGRESHSQAE
jgi:hypothetical protein